MLTSTIQELIGIKLTLVPTVSLNVQIFLPNDAGGPGAPAPLADVVVTHDSGYHREQQGPGSGIIFPKLLANGRYNVTAGELGGEERSVSGTRTFSNGATTRTIGLAADANN